MGLATPVRMPFDWRIDMSIYKLGDIFPTYNCSILSYTVISGAPTTITLQKNGVEYNYGESIIIGDKITVFADVNCVIDLQFDVFSYETIFNGTTNQPWTRPADWLEIDSLVDASMHRWVGLMAVYDETVATNPQNIQTFNSSQAYTVEIDGVATNYLAGVTAEIQVTWASVEGTTTSEGFRQSIIEVYPQVGNWTGTFSTATARTTKPIAFNSQFIDIRMSAPNITNYTQSSGNVRQSYLKQHVWLGTHQVISRVSAFSFSTVSYLEEDFSNASNLASFMATSDTDISIFPQVTTNATSLNACWHGSQVRKFGNVTANLSTNCANVFRESQVTEIGDVSFSISTSFQNGSYVNTKLTSFGTCNIPLSVTINSAWYGNLNLETLGVITTSASLTDIASAFGFCRKLQGINISNCSGVTTTTTALTECTSLNSLILTGLTRGITVPPCNMNEQSFIDFFNSLGTASGAQTIIGTGNVALSAPTIAIATGKGYTLVW